MSEPKHHPAGLAGAETHGVGGAATPSPQAHPPSECFGPALEPGLREACQGRLSKVQWFRSQWQRGGASTGLATYTTADGDPVSAVVKVPVGYSEYRWTVRLNEAAAEANPTAGPTRAAYPSPRVLASGLTVNGYDLGWLVLEKLNGSPLAEALSPDDVHDMIDATARVQMLAGRIEKPEAFPAQPDWARMLDQSREVIKRTNFPDGQRWNNELKAVHRCIGTLIRRWGDRGVNSWCHGDLHPGNAMRRNSAHGSGNQPGPCVLIDLAMMHAGHWVEDALYFERVYWGHLHLLHGINLVSALSAARRAIGLPCTGDYGTLANVRRVLAAACAPALLEREGNPKYLHHALDLIARLLPAVGH